jgi:hypothetical protein
VKIFWICGLLCLLLAAAYGRISIARTDAGETRTTAPAPQSAAAADLSAYVLLHETRGTRIPLRANACPE